jgi:ribonuclease HI
MPWERRRYRGHKVYVEFDGAGALVVDDRGFAHVRYREGDARTYSARPSEVLPIDAADPVRPESSPPARPAVEETADPDADVPALAGKEIHAYTDGAASGNPGPAGLGVVLLFKDKKKEVSRYLGETTNNVAELAAILEALRLVKNRALPVKVHADSSYAIGVVTGSMRAKANRDLVEEIRREAALFPSLTFVKVSGHSGVTWNELADRLARLAITRHAPRR